MDEPVSSDSRLEVSVSFGRFDNDALSWEKWSSFSPNKYLDEAGSLSTPGSVAQKKAYFEAHYKKIASQKSEQFEQENPMEPVASSRDELTADNHSETSSGMHAYFELCNGEKSNGVVAHEAVVDEAKDEDTSSLVVEQGACSNGFMDMSILEEEKEEASTAVENLNPMDDEAKKELNVLEADHGLNVREEAAPVEEEIPILDPEHVEHPPESKNTAEQLTEPRKRSSKLNAGNINQKVTQTKIERNLTGTRSKAVSPAVKHSHASTPKYLKPSLISTPTSASLSEKKKMNRSMVVESKSAAPTSLHMSLSLGPAKSSNPFAMTRKSLIMEKMGDKDIVRRAFKSFQSQINGYPTDEKSSTLKQVLSSASELKISPSPTHRKENTGLRNAAEKMVNRRNQTDQQSKAMLLGSHKSSVLDKKNTIVVSPSVGLKSYEKDEKRKEFLRNSEAKSTAREAENAQLRAKSKEEKTPEIRKLRQTLNFKATPLPSFYQRQGKDHSEKETAGNKTAHRRPAASSTR